MCLLAGMNLSKFLLYRGVLKIEIKKRTLFVGENLYENLYFNKNYYFSKLF